MTQSINETPAQTNTNVSNTTPTITRTIPPKVRASRSFASKMGLAEAMLSGLTNHLGALSKRGIDAAFMTKINSFYQNIIDAHNAKLAFKARMMEKAKETRDNLQLLKKLYSEAKQQVKMTLPKETWREFGIMDLR